MSGIELPLPGDDFHGRTVIASVWLNDDPDEELLGLLMVLNPRSPYYLVGQIVPGNEGARYAWDLAGDERHHMNINHATADFADSGGDV